jgi:hypothetical protein
MIQPANIAFQGVVGGTFDTQITLFDGNLEYVWYGIWQPFRTYPVNAMVAGADANVYASLNEIAENDNPVTDGGTNWAPLDKLNLTGWTGSATIATTGNPSGPSVTVAATMGGTEGTVAVKFTGTQMSVFAVGSYDFNIEVIDTDTNNYFPVIGTIALISPTP